VTAADKNKALAGNTGTQTNGTPTSGIQEDLPSSATRRRGGASTTDLREQNLAEAARPRTPADALAMAEEAEAEAAEAEAIAAAARARARAIRLRREAAAAAGDAPDEDDSADRAVGVAAGEPTEDAADAAETDSESSTATSEQDEDNADDGDGDVAIEKPQPTRARGRQRWLRIPRLIPRRVPRASSAAAAVAILLICTLLAASGYLAWQHRQASQDRQRTAEFAAAARQGVVTLTSLDFNRAKDDVQRVIDNSTGSFKADFQSRADDFRSVVEQSKVVTKGTVNATAVESMTADSAVVLVAATSQVTNAAGARQEPRAWRLSVTMTRDGGQLKMSKVEFVP
jgi:Mce-associated membrane protein